jgi:TetR/AcrR family transcriptional regulator, regulator of cefoperazone and chloramphenicol sensitivity
MVRHHFGSKESLRDICDAYAMAQITSLREQMLVEGRLADHTFVVSANPAARLIQAYLTRSMMDGSVAASALFNDMVRLTEEWLADHNVESTDRHALAAALVAMQMGLLIMHEQLTRSLAVDVNTPPATPG